MRAVDEKNLENLLLKQIAKLPMTKIHIFFHSIDLKNTELYLLQLHFIYIFFKVSWRKKSLLTSELNLPLFVLIFTSTTRSLEVKHGSRQWKNLKAKIVVLKNFAIIHRKTTVLESFFDKLPLDLQLYRKRPHQRCFAVNVANSLRTYFFRKKHLHHRCYDKVPNTLVHNTKINK